MLPLHLTNLGLGHHGGFAVTERGKWQTQLGFFVPLKEQKSLEVADLHFGESVSFLLTLPIVVLSAS